MEVEKHICIRPGSRQSANITLCEVQLRKGAKTFRATPRRYGPKQHSFIESTTLAFEKIGVVYRNPSACWASPALAVPKPGTEHMRFTVDLRAINAITVLVQNS